MKLNKLKTFCGWMVKVNRMYDKNESIMVFIALLMLILLPKSILVVLLAGFIFIRHLHIEGNWWYEWSDIEETGGDHIEERDNSTGC